MRAKRSADHLPRKTAQSNRFRAPVATSTTRPPRVQNGGHARGVEYRPVTLGNERAISGWLSY